MRVLRVPVVVAKWFLVVLGAVLWLAVVPIVDAVWDALRRLVRLVSPRRSPQG
jgi:hypothetical protein